MELDTVGQQAEKIAVRIANEMGVELVHCQIAGTKRNPIVRIFIDKPGGVTIEDCSNLSRAIEAIFDVEDFIPTSYVLEVSSPGLDRELFGIKDFAKFAGRKAKVKTSDAIKGQRIFSGRIEGVEDDIVIIDDKTSGIVRFPFESVAKANLMIDLHEEFKKK
jgi:ribosome maturation factor RimP